MEIFCFYLSFQELLLFINRNNVAPLMCKEKILLFCISGFVLDDKLAPRNLLSGCRFLGIINFMCILIDDDQEELRLVVFSDLLCIRF